MHSKETILKRERQKRKDNPPAEKNGTQENKIKKKLTFKEKREYEQLEKDIEALEQEQKQIEEALCGQVTDVEELTRMSKRLPLLKDELEEKSMRWLELSEFA